MEQLMKRIRGQFAMLIAEFLLGTSINLIGAPDEIDSAGLKIVDRDIAGTHVLIAIGLIVGAIMTNRLASKYAPNVRRLAGAGGGGGVGLAVLGGLGTFALPGTWSSIASFVMAAGFICSFLSYGKVYVQLHAKA